MEGARPIAPRRPETDAEHAGKPCTSNDPESEALLESIVETTGQLDIDDRGYWDFHGHSSGLSFLRRMRRRYGDLFGPENSASPFLATPSLPQVYNLPELLGDVSVNKNASRRPRLPPKPLAMALASNALEEASALMRCVHQPTLYALLDRVYGIAPDKYGDEETRFLPLLYVILALGCLFAKTEQSELGKKGYVCATTQG